jgi:hypothetical protein
LGCAVANALAILSLSKTLHEKKEAEVKLSRVKIVMWLARQLGVPVEVHQAFFVKGIRSKMSGS